MEKTRARQGTERGFALIGTYMVLSFFLVYSQVMTMRTMTERVAQDQYRAEAQALDLAQGAVEQLREDFYNFSLAVYLSSVAFDINGNGVIEQGEGGCTGDAICAFGWLDKLSLALRDPSQPEKPLLALPIGAPLGTGKVDKPLCLDNALPNALPTIPRLDGQGQPVQCLSRAQSDAPGAPSAWLPRAWISSITCPSPPCKDDNHDGQWDNMLLPRWVAIDGEARVGSITKHIRAVYTVDLRMSDIWRAAQTANNLVLAHVDSTATAKIYGEMYSNGDMIFDSNGILSDAGESVGNITVDGDLYASKNLALTSLQGGTPPPPTGKIYGDPTQDAWDGASSLGAWGTFWKNRPWKSRPANRLVAPGQPWIGGTPELLDADPDYGSGFGWNSESPDPNFPEQKKKENLDPINMPYLGNLDFYRTLAVEYDGNNGSSLKVNDGNPPDKVKNGVYLGQDGIAGTGDENGPLVLIGTPSNPIIIDGPVVIPSDVIIRGMVTGRGVIYAGRNVHVIGDVTYCTSNSCTNNGWSPLDWPAPLERNPGTGQIRTWQAGNLGTVADNGTFVSSGGCD